MKKYTFTEKNQIEIWNPEENKNNDLIKKMNSSKYQWDPKRKVLVGENNLENMETYIKIRGSQDYAFKPKIQNIINITEQQLQACLNLLNAYVNSIMTEDNHREKCVSDPQTRAWEDCFKFIKTNLKNIDTEKQNFRLIFEYSMPGTVHERPDILLLTDKKVICLEFKNKLEPQIDNNQNDVAQAIRYKEWLENHHKVTKDKNMEVKSYLVCTCDGAQSGKLRNIDILTKDNFLDTLEAELSGENPCSFINEWLTSPKTEMPDMLQAIETMYRKGIIPYISDVNKECLNKVIGYIDRVKNDGINKEQNLTKKILILIDGVPGSGKTAVGQSVVYKENKNGEANAVYLSGNGPLVEVLQYQINKIGKKEHMAENAIQGMKEFKSTYFYSVKTPEQSILIFDEAQRAWDKNKMKKDFNEPEGLFQVAERIYEKRGYAVIIGLYGNGQVIYTGEEKGLSLWDEALKNHKDWTVILSDELNKELAQIEDTNLQNDKQYKYNKITDPNLSLSASLRADFIDCSKWVEAAISNEKGDFEKAKKELEKLNKTSMRISITRDFKNIETRKEEIDKEHPDWKYGILISNFAEQQIVYHPFPDWNIGYNGTNVVSNNEYGPWFNGECKNLDKACTVYGNQGLELDCPIILFGGAYIRRNGQWISQGTKFNKDKNKYDNAHKIVENNFRVLLTRARKEMILFIPNIKELDETYNYFVSMGMEVLPSTPQPIID